MNCPTCNGPMEIDLNIGGLDMAYYRCASCNKRFGYSLLVGGKPQEVDEKGLPIIIQKRRKEDWEPKKGDRVWVSGKTWSSAGTIIGFAKDDPEVPWIKVDKDGSSWDARDAGSIRRLEDK